MKKHLVLAIVIACVLLITSAALADAWICPKCGQTGNTGNFCPNCATARPSTTKWTCQVCGATGNTGNYCPYCASPKNPTPAASYVTASLKMRVSTRSGPSTGYDELGTYFNNTWQNEKVKVYSKAYGSGVWWLQIEFQTKNGPIRAYTGLKRVNVDINKIPEETCLGYGQMNLAGDVQGYYGPGKNYPYIKKVIPWSSDVSIWASENNYYLVEFYDASMGVQRRAWVPRDWVYVY